MTQPRDSHGRFKADRHKRNTAIGVTTAVGAVAGLVGAALRFGLLDRLFPDREGHAAPDLAEGKPRPDGSARAPVDFRPDPTAAVPASERDAMRPATLN
jgi:hypothetical protein